MDLQELARHKSKESCYIAIHGNVWDVTDFLSEHPGGSAILLKYSGQDGTDAYSQVHPPDLVKEHLSPDKNLGPLNIPAPSGDSKVAVQSLTPEQSLQLYRRSLLPPLSQILSIGDFTAPAKFVLPATSWAYYSSGSDDEITLRENSSAYGRIWFRPRVLIDVKIVSTKRSMLGTPCDLPIYATATALGKLGCDEGEVALTKGLAGKNVIQMIPTLASCSFDEMVDARSPGQTQWMQLYVNQDRSKTKKIVQHAILRGVTALFITVDAPQLGRREKDMRGKFTQTSAVQDGDSSVERNQGAARAISSFIDPALSWKDIDWFHQICAEANKQRRAQMENTSEKPASRWEDQPGRSYPIVLKGVQCWEDCVKAVEYGCAGVVLSNHGGRQLDFARSGIEVLVECVEELIKRKMWPNKNFEIFVDGGVTRATDVLKAVALGATAVGLGRPFIYSYSGYGQQGVEHLCNILKDEMEMDLRLIGAQSLEQVTSDLVNASAVKNHNAIPVDHIFDSNYEKLAPVAIQSKL